MANRQEARNLAEIERRDRERAKKREQERYSEKEKLKKSEFITDDFYKIIRMGAGAMSSDDITFADMVKEIEELYNKSFTQKATEEIRKNRCLDIFSYMAEYGILENLVNYLSDEPINYLVENIDGKGINSRVQKMYKQIDESTGAETLTLDAFLVNRMSKIIDQITNHYLNTAYGTLFRRFSGSDVAKSILEDDLFNLPKEKISEIEKWFNKGENAKLAQKTNFNDFVDYLKLRNIQDKFYEEKDRDIISLCKEYPNLVMDYTEDADVNRLIYVKPENYGLPIGLHIPREVFESAIKEETIKKPSEREARRRMQSFPIKFTDDDLEIFNRGLKKYYRSEEEELGLVFDDEKDDEEEEKNNTEQEKSKTEKKERAKPKKAKYKSDEETLQMVEGILADHDIVKRIPEEYMEKLNSRSKFNNTKLEKVYLDIKEFIQEKGIDGESLELETAKMFCYMKILDRGFWVTNAEKREQVFQKQFEEVKEYNSELFILMNAGFSLQELKLKMKDRTGYGKIITGAKTLDEKGKVKKASIQKQKEKMQERENIKTEKAPEKVTIEDTITDYQEVQKVENIEEKKITENNQTEILEEQEQVIDEPKEVLAEQDEEYTQLDFEMDQLHKEHDELKEKEEKIKQGKQKLEQGLNEIINGMEPLETRRKKIRRVLSEQNMKFLKELEMEQKIEEANQKLNEIEKQLNEYKSREKETKGKIKESNKELEEIQKRKVEVKDKIDDLFRDL